MLKLPGCKVWDWLFSSWSLSRPHQPILSRPPRRGRRLYTKKPRLQPSICQQTAHGIRPTPSAWSVAADTARQCPVSLSASACQQRQTQAASNHCQPLTPSHPVPAATPAAAMIGHAPSMLRKRAGQPTRLQSQSSPFSRVDVFFLLVSRGQAVFMPVLRLFSLADV
jgi:hypothetical protein